MKQRWLGSALVVLSALLSACSQDTADPPPPVKETTSVPPPSVAPETRDYMATVSRPNRLNLIDLHDNTVVRSCELPGLPAPGTLLVSPDGQFAYTLTAAFSDVYGVSLDTCEVVFSTRQSDGNVRVKSIASLAISPDGKEIYTHQNRVTLNSDHYHVEPSKIAVFDTSAGLDSRPVRTLDAPRQVTIMKTGDDGSLYLGGPDIYQMDGTTGEYKVALASRTLDDPRYSPRYILTVWPIGEVNNELHRMYSVARYQEGSTDIETADFMWGYERINLETGEADAKDFGPLEVVLFTSLRRPGHPDKIYGVLSQLQEFDASSETLVRSIDLEHTYYCINFSTDGSKLYLSGALSDVAVYDADSLEKITNIQLSGDMGMANSYVFSRDTI